MYADFAYYTDVYGGSKLSEQAAPAALERASDAVDVLTCCRIRGVGFEALTEHQQRVIRRVVCALAEWQTENADGLSSPYKQYAVNGVSMSFGVSDAVRSVSGVLVPSELYSLLVTTGLCYGGV